MSTAIEKRATGPRPAVVDRPGIVAGTESGEKPEDMFQVILWNDDYTEAGFVVRCLMHVFGHPAALATKIMLEAHHTGKAIAEVEGPDAAALHGRQLQSSGLTVTVEKV